MYRLTSNAKKFAALRAAKAAKREAGEAPEYPPDLPALRRRIIVQDFTFGEKTHVLEFYSTNRIDCFRVMVDGELWKKRIGFSRALAGLRKSLPRVMSL